MVIFDCERCAGATFASDTFPRPEVAFSNTFPLGNVLIANHKTELELLLPQTHFVIRGSIPQRASNCERANMNLNTALELLLPQTHFVIRGSIPQLIPHGKVRL